MSGVGESSERTGSEGATWRVFVFDLASSVGAVVLVGALLFAVSGVWPPMVAIESGSMEPHMERGDLVLVMDEARFHGAGAHESGVVTARVGAQTGYSTFQGPGDVIVFAPDGNAGQTPIIHRAMFQVEEGENWYDRADPAHLNGAESCEALANCPAPDSGFVTKGDSNRYYDQISSHPGCDGTCDPVRREWIVGTAEARIPLIGELRLRAAGVAATAQTDDGNATDAVETRGGGPPPLTAAPTP